MPFSHIIVRFTAFASITLVALLGGCSAANMAYNNAPTAVAFYADDWLDLTGEQRDWLKPRITALLEWHRTAELPAYRQLLDEASQRVSKPATREDVQILYTQTRRAVERLSEKAMPDMVAFLQLLEPRQVSYLEGKFARDNAKLAKALSVGLDTRREERLARYVERFEAWMGKLSSEQRSLIKSRIDTLPFSEELRLEDRKRWQTSFVALLKTRPDAAALERELRVLLLTPQTRRSSSYQAKWDAQQKLVTELTADLMALASPAQQKRLQKKLAGYSQDVIGLLKT